MNKAYIYCDEKNIASRKGIEKAGFKESFRIKYLNILGFKWKRRIYPKDKENKK